MTRRSRTPRPHPLVVPLIRRLFVPFLARRYRLSARGLSALQTVSPPYVVVANHVSFWDPFWVNAFIRHPIQFVASDNLFRSFFLGFAMRLLGAIPKTKLMNDPETVRHIFNVLAGGGVIGIFPEGSRTNDGRASPLIPAVARLLRKLKVPVVGARMEGGYLTRPRWARHSRRGAVEITYQGIFSGNEISRLTEQEVLAVIGRALDYNDHAWQRVRGVRFRSRRAAEYLERLLFLCPHCRSVSRIVSLDDRARCTSCEYSVRVNESGSFDACSGPLYFENPTEWNAWQLPIFERMLTARGTFVDFVFEEPRARLLTGYRARPLRAAGTGPARLTRGQILFAGNSGSVTFNLPDVHGMNVQNREKLEFYHDRVLYRLDFLDPRASAYKWSTAAGILSACEPEARSLIRVNTY
jgi:1-acyl-sn-glycerol-3-phosphate acyltransferase